MGYKDIYSSVLKEYPDVLTVEQMCSALGVSHKTGYRLIKDNKIGHMKIGRAYRIPKAHLLTYMRVIFTHDVN